MKEPSLAPAFAVVYTILAEAARSVGYALAVHGSMGRDLDVIAVPWTKDAMGPTFLISAICKATGGEQHMSDLRLHGRMSVGILLGCGGFVDLSIMPRMTQSAVRTYSSDDLEQLGL